MEKMKVYKTIHWQTGNWYGDHFVWTDEAPFPESKDAAIVQFIARSMKAKVLEHIPTPSRIEHEEIMLRPSFKDEDYPQVFKATIIWKAELFWEDE